LPRLFGLDCDRAGEGKESQEGKRRGKKEDREKVESGESEEKIQGSRKWTRRGAAVTTQVAREELKLRNNGNEFGQADKPSRS